MAGIVRYPTRGLATWDKMKELRRKYNRLGWEARAQGGVIAVCQNATHPILAGIGLWGRRVYGPYFGKAMQNHERLAEYHNVADARGFPRGDICSSMHHFVGELVMGHTTVNPWTGEHSPVDFVLEFGTCPAVNKTAQFAGEFLGVPHFVLDVPQEGGDAAIKYLTTRIHEEIEFLVRVTGKEYDDERLIEGTINWWEQGVLFARLCEATKATPAPLDLQMLFQISVPSAVGGHCRDVVDLYVEMLAEVNEQVRDGISARGVETVRLSHEGEPMYYAEDFIPGLVARYGGVIIAGQFPFGGGIYDIDGDGRWTAAPRFADMGVSLCSREDAVAFLARCFALNSPGFRTHRLPEKVGEYLHRAQDWHCHGVIQHLDTGCRSEMAGVLEARAEMIRAGVPAVTYQSSNGDPANFSPQQVSSSIESFLERLGLRPLSLPASAPQGAH